MRKYSLYFLALAIGCHGAALSGYSYPGGSGNAVPNSPALEVDQNAQADVEAPGVHVNADANQHASLDSIPPGGVHISNSLNVNVNAGRGNGSSLTITTIMTAPLSSVTATSTSTTSSSTSTPTPSNCPNQYNVSTCIDWQPCYEFLTFPPSINVTCANLSAPLDYSNPTSGETVTIGVARVRPAGSTQASGILLTNPGGPGEAVINSTLYSIASEGVMDDFLQIILPSNQELILIDPRGMGRSNPGITCGLTPTSYNEIQGSQTSVSSNYTSQGTILSDLNANTWLGTQCSKTDDSELRFLGSMTTATQCQDYDFVRNLTGFASYNAWSFSYGTAILAICANMFPESTGRFVLDGTLDIVAHTGPVFPLSVKSHDEIIAVLSIWAQQCAQAGATNPSWCPLYEGSSNSSDIAVDILNRAIKVLARLVTQPIQGAEGYGQPAEVVSFETQMSRVRSGLNAPTGSTGYLFLAQTFLSLENGTPSTNSPPDTSMQPTDGSDINPDFTFDTDLNSGIEYNAINCQDSTLGDQSTINSAANFIAESYQTLIPAGIFASNFAQCITWPRKYQGARYDGPFNNARATPAMVIGIPGDCATSYSDSLATYDALGAENAIFFIHEAIGHCTIKDPNPCTTAAIQAYLRNGEEPLHSIFWI